MLPLFRCFSNDQNGTVDFDTLFSSSLLSFRTASQAVAFFFFFFLPSMDFTWLPPRAAVKSSTNTPLQVVKASVGSPTSQQLCAGFEISVSSGRGGFPWRGCALNYHHLARLPSCNHVFKLRIWGKKTDVMWADLSVWCFCFFFFWRGLTMCVISLLRYLIKCKDKLSSRWKGEINPSFFLPYTHF